LIEAILVGAARFREFIRMLDHSGKEFRDLVQTPLILVPVDLFHEAYPAALICTPSSFLASATQASASFP
jgi:hypothetical protein